MVRVRDFRAAPPVDGGTGGRDLGPIDDDPLTVLTVTANGAAMGNADHVYPDTAGDPARGQLFRHQSAARVYRAGRP